MKKALSACLFSTVLLFPFAASAQAPLVRFDSGIGVVPVRAGPAANIVRGVNPGGQPWVISRLVVDIKTDGRISVDGRGLLLGGGDTIGTNGNQSVRARLFCGPAPGVMHDSVLMPYRLSQLLGQSLIAQHDSSYPPVAMFELNGKALAKRIV